MRKWSREYERCSACGTTEFRHQAKGQCLRCYWRIKRGLPAVPVPRRSPDAKKKPHLKKCQHCQIYKQAGTGERGEPSEFYARRDGSGYAKECILCSRERFRAYYQANKGKEQARYYRNKAKKAGENPALKVETKGPS